MSAQEPPSFRADRVLAGDRPLPLIPGMFMSIYGENLGPVQSCAGQPDPQQRETASPLLHDTRFANLSVYPTPFARRRF